MINLRKSPFLWPLLRLCYGPFQWQTVNPLSKYSLWGHIALKLVFPEQLRSGNHRHRVIPAISEAWWPRDGRGTWSRQLHRYAHVLLAQQELRKLRKHWQVIHLVFLSFKLQGKSLSRLLPLIITTTEVNYSFCRYVIIELIIKQIQLSQTHLFHKFLFLFGLRLVIYPGKHRISYIFPQWEVNRQSFELFADIFSYFTCLWSAKFWVFHIELKSQYQKFTFRI